MSGRDEVMIDEVKNAIKWIDSQSTKFARTTQEKAKYLVSTTLPKDMPHPSVWWNVLKLAKGIR